MAFLVKVWLEVEGFTNLRLLATAAVLAGTAYTRFVSTAGQRRGTDISSGTFLRGEWELVGGIVGGKGSMKGTEQNNSVNCVHVRES